MINDEKVRVSIICLAYNEERYIKKALDSMLNQKTAFRFEILCHDDASNDKTTEIIQEYETRYPNIVRGIYQKENKYQKGEQIILKYIYPLAKGEYMAYCDADDFWTDNRKLQKQVDFLDLNPEYGMCLHAFHTLKEKNGKERVCRFHKGDCDLDIRSAIKWDSRTIPQLGTSLFRKKLAYERPPLFHKIGGDENSERFISDHPLYIYMTLVSKVHYFDSDMSCWRRRISGTWGKGTPTFKVLNHQIVHRDFFKKLDEYTNYEYHKECEFEIKQSYLKTDLANSNYKKVVKNPTFCSISLKLRMLVLAGCVFPKLADKALGKR